MNPSLVEPGSDHYRYVFVESSMTVEPADADAFKSANDENGPAGGKIVHYIDPIDSGLGAVDKTERVHEQTEYEDEYAFVFVNDRKEIFGSHHNRFE